MPQRDTQKERAEVLADITLSDEERQAKLKELEHIDFMRRKYQQLYAQEILMAPEVEDYIREEL